LTHNRTVKKTILSRPTMDGAGVRLKRVFGFSHENSFDPFLLLDNFGGDDPKDYIKGFPWHPHRGIETITYMLYGNVAHGDSMGNSGVIGPGDVQWMTAGSGIIHQEMPQGDETGRMGGFQLWANLPADHKMMPPRYQEIKSGQIPEITTQNGVTVRILCGEVDGTHGPVQDIVIDPEYLDIAIPTGGTFVHPTKLGHTVLAYVFEGAVRFSDGEGLPDASIGNLVLFSDGEQVSAFAGDSPARFLLISGKPIGEPVAWYGPIVMNTQAELEIAYKELDNGTFIK
jgi:redox-sensitive bicupin YhaK (pirin superfamily)